MNNQAPPPCTGAGTVATEWQGAAALSQFPTSGTCGICGGRWPIDGFFNLKVHPYVGPRAVAESDRAAAARAVISLIMLYAFPDRQDQIDQRAVFRDLLTALACIDPSIADEVRTHGAVHVYEQRWADKREVSE